MLSADCAPSRHSERHVERLVVTGLVLLAALPAIMTFARTSPPLITALIALLLGIVARLNGSWSTIVRQSKDFALGPAGILLLAGLVLMALSLLWTPASERALRHLFQLIGSVILIWILLSGIPSHYTGKLNFLMPVGLAFASLLIIVHFAMSSPINAMLGVPTDGYYVNRTALTLALFAPVVLTVLWRRERFLIAGFLALLLLIAIWLSDSWSAKLASLVIAGSIPISLLAPRHFHMLAAFTMLVALLTAPLYIGLVNNLIPQNIHNAVGYGSLTVRGEIWQEYASLIWQRPFFGFGLEASNVIPWTDVVVGLSEAQIELLSYGHPHNAVVQIWFELGLSGTLIAALLLGLSFRAMTRLQDWQLSIATTTSLGVYTVACVSHGAWQAWWICLVGLVAFVVVEMIFSNNPIRVTP